MRTAFAGHATRLAARAIAVVARAVALAAAFAWAPAMAGGARLGAQESAAATMLETFGMSGSMRLGYWSSTRDLDTVEPGAGAMAWLKASREVGRFGAYHVEVWTATRGPHDSVRSRAELREAYVDLRFPRLDLRVGRQIIAWGRADGINPTDNVTPRDLTILVPDDADRRVGTSAARANLFLGGLTLSAIWAPEFRPHHVSLPTPPAGVVFRERFDRWPGETWGVRIERTGGRVDWSASYLNGRDLTPDLSFVGDAGSGIVDLRHQRLWVAGLDGAMNVGRFGLRAEAAYVGTVDDRGIDPFTKNHFLFVVAGVDRRFVEHLVINVQYLGRHVRDWQPPPTGGNLADAVARQGAVFNSQMARTQHGMTARVRHAWLRETLEAELAGVVLFGPVGRSVIPKVTYAISDHWKIVAGAELYRGEADAVFGLLQPNSVGFAELRLSF